MAYDARRATRGIAVLGRGGGTGPSALRPHGAWRLRPRLSLPGDLTVTVSAGTWDGGGEARQERERVEVDGGGAVAAGTAEDDAHEVVGEQPQAFLCDRRAQDALDEGLARAGVVGASVGGGMQREAHLLRQCDGEM